jgi:hypothetical protein
MVPSIFSTVQPDATPLQYMHRARMFRDAAQEMENYRSNEQNWPKYALLCHAAELALKAFVNLAVAKGGTLPALPPHNHDLLGRYQLAVQFGLECSAQIEEEVSLLNELHRNHFMRYPQLQSKPLPDLSFADSTVEHLISVITPFTNPL